MGMDHGTLINLWHVTRSIKEIYFYIEKGYDSDYTVIGGVHICEGK